MVTRHEPAFLALNVRALKAGEIHVGAGQRNAGGLLILSEPRGVNLLNFVEVFLKTAWVVREASPADSHH